MNRNDIVVCTTPLRIVAMTGERKVPAARLRVRPLSTARSV